MKWENLPYTIHIPIPVFDREHLRLKPDLINDWAHRVATRLATRLGGATVADSQGYYMDKAGCLLVDRGQRVVTAAVGGPSSQLQRAVDDLRPLVKQMAVALNQESAYIGAYGGSSRLLLNVDAG